MITGYIRVSTGKQHPENQQDEITRYAKENGMVVDRWVTEIVSGKKVYSGRKLGRLISRMKKGDTIIVSEVSRLSRNLTDILTIMGNCLKKGINIYTVKERYRFDDSINSKILCFAFGLVAEIERNLISQRTKEALARLKAEGKHIGRVKGSPTNPKFFRLYRHDAYIRRAIARGMRQCEIIRRLRTNRSTYRRYVDRFIFNGASIAPQSNPSDKPVAGVAGPPPGA